jgi:UDP-N-acetylmuramate--alanine ligase
MHLFAPDDPRPIHFMGIAGAGMSAVALVSLRRGVPVTGCDADPHGAPDAERLGARVSKEHDPNHVTGCRAVVYTAAVPADHEELEAARAAGIPVIPRAKALGMVVEGATLVGVAGTHGKTTVTAMAAHGLAAAGVDPTALVGGRVAAWDGNVRFGADQIFVVEADEYDRSFLALEPTVAVVNNVEPDHLECYGSVEELEAAFVTFASSATRVLVGADDRGANRVAKAVTGPFWRVGTVANADIRLTDVRRDAEQTAARLELPGDRSVDIRLRVPGLHNLRNAAMTVAVGLALEADPEAVARGLGDFEGVGRRFELLGTHRGITFVDDYAHHPSEIAATLGAARQRFPGARLVAVFQPHLYSRTKALGPAMGIALSTADLAVVTEVYAAREQPIRGVTGERVAKAVRRAGGQVEWVASRTALPDQLEQMIAKGDVVITLGAGDITDVGRELARRRSGAAA